MPAAIALGIQVPRVVRIGGELVWDAFQHRHARRLQRRNLGRIVGHEPDRPHPQQFEHPRRHWKIARFIGQAKPRIGIDVKQLLEIKRELERKNRTRR